MATIRATGLTTFALAPDGGSVSIGVADDCGEASALVLPTSCLPALVMTLPDVAQQALCRKYRDPALRLVFPVKNWTIETTETADRLVLTFATSNGFRASFGLFLHEFAEIASTALTGDAAALDEIEPSDQRH